ncbi:hypothetical protein EVAR_28884_1 [Eumeta japonica]|uniref:Uncharacterized protein n=1 Tax=Eumeta variegata TaxID=151549 RepID=A0A4C1X1S8_EUMVA|nr:hypothetical protein EVAR_28884_1 [Eumeta japonica]
MQESLYRPSPVPQRCAVVRRRGDVSANTAERSPRPGSTAAMWYRPETNPDIGIGGDRKFGLISRVPFIGAIAADAVVTNSRAGACLFNVNSAPPVPWSCRVRRGIVLEITTSARLFSARAQRTKFALSNEHFIL